MNERVCFERYRLAVISAWPEGEEKGAALASARAALQREIAFEKMATAEVLGVSDQTLLTAYAVADGGAKTGA